MLPVAGCLIRSPPATGVYNPSHLTASVRGFSSRTGLALLSAGRTSGVVLSGNNRRPARSALYSQGRKGPGIISPLVASLRAVEGRRRFRFSLVRAAAVSRAPPVATVAAFL